MVFPGSAGSAAVAVLGVFWLFGPGLIVPLLFARRDVQDKAPRRFEHLRASSVYRPVQPTPRAHRLRA